MGIKWNLEDELPWKNINAGVNSEFLKQEYQKSLNGNITPWCEAFGCYGCGSCSK